MRTERSLLERAGLASGLLTDAQIDQAWHVLVESSPAAGLSLEEIDDGQLATQLIELGFLNRWQAEQLRYGRTKFTLGSYRILDAIGHGGMGWVFKCEHELLGRIEAVKVLPKNQTNSMSIESFRREIRAQAQLDHSNLVRLSYADRDGNTYFLVTEFVPGSDLRHIVRQHGPLSPEKSAIVVSQAAEALDYAHAQGLIHRDVKPGNLLITPEGRTKLTDLGLAFFASDQEELARSKPKHIVGTADFLAPEIIVTPSEVLPISDVYSLGCTLYYAATGKVPFPGGDTADKLRRQLDELPIPPQRLNPEVDDEFAAVIAHMMQKRPAERIASAATVVDRLRPWVDAAGATAFQEIGALAQTPRDRDYSAATLAETIPDGHVAADFGRLPAETPRPIESPWGQTPPPPPLANSPAPDPPAGLGNATMALVAFAVGLALTAVYLVLTSVS